MKKGKVLLIVHDIYQDDIHFPLGVGYLASALRDFGAEVIICDQAVHHYSNKEMAEKFLENDEYDLIGIGFLAARFKETILDLCKIVNMYKKNAKLILGGHGPSAIPEYMLETTGADLVAIGESESTIVEVLDSILRGGSFKKVLGIAYREGSDFYVNNRRLVNRKIDTVSFPAWDLFSMNYYTTCMVNAGQKSNSKTTEIISSRGCTNNCTFCYRLEKGIRFRNIQNVVQEMKYLYDKYGVTHFHFLDELFVVSHKRLESFVAELRKEKLLGKIHYTAGGIRANTVTECMGGLLRDSGCCYANVGFESMSQQCLDELKKKVTIEDNVRCAKILQKYDVIIGANFIWGAPSDTEETLKQAVTFLKEHNTYGELRTIRPITPYPGSEMYNQAISKGLLTGPQDFFDKFKNSDLLTVNFTTVPTEKAHGLLYEANKDLILDHYKHTTNDTREAWQIIDEFYNLYFKGFTEFKGARKHKKVDNV